MAPTSHSTPIPNHTQANRNRTYQTLLDNSITNTVILAGDSHANWVSDLVWYDHTTYDPLTGTGAVGVEFAGTAVSSTGFGTNLARANNQSASLVRDNSELQWNEGYFRGYFELYVSKEKIDAMYFGCASVASRNSLEISLANFTVVSGENRLSRPVGGGSVESGVLRGGSVMGRNLTRDTSTGVWEEGGDLGGMFIVYPDDEE
jgi:alkaline phosphatase D